MIKTPKMACRDLGCFWQTRSIDPAKLNFCRQQEIRKRREARGTDQGKGRRTIESAEEKANLKYMSRLADIGSLLQLRLYLHCAVILELGSDTVFERNRSLFLKRS